MVATKAPFYSINNQLRKAPFYAGDGGNKGFFLQWRWWQQRLISMVAMAATKASFNGGNGGNKGPFQRWQWQQQRFLSMAVMAATKAPSHGGNGFFQQQQMA
jgi:hypothetical protein